MSDEKETSKKDGKNDVVRQGSLQSTEEDSLRLESFHTAQESLESAEDVYASAQDFDDQNSFRKSVKFEESDSQLAEIIEVVREEEDHEDDESEKTPQMRLDFIPRTSIILDDEEQLQKSESGTLEAPKSEYYIEETDRGSLKQNTSSMEAFQFVKRYATSKPTGVGNALVTDAFVSFCFQS